MWVTTAAVTCHRWAPLLTHQASYQAELAQLSESGLCCGSEYSLFLFYPTAHLLLAHAGAHVAPPPRQTSRKVSATKKRA